MDFKELLQIIAYGLGVAFCLVFILTFLLSHFVALKKPPKGRALWTVGLGYAGYLALLVFSLPSEYLFAAVALSIPASVVIYFHFRRSFAKLWFDDPSLMPEGTKVANDDWRVALYFLLAAVVAVLLKKLIYGFSI